MKKIILVVAATLYFLGCEKDYNSVMEPETYQYQVIKVDPVSPFIYFPGNVTRLRIRFNSSEFISNVTLNIYTPTGERFFETPVYLTELDSSIFTYVLKMQQTDLSGNYTVKYFVTDIAGSTTEAAVQKFDYNNGSANTAPQIINVEIDPDTMVLLDSTDVMLIKITAEITDEQGLIDIELAYFIVYKPDGTTNGNQTLISDDGVQNDVSWDATADDGIFSRIIQVTGANTKGTYRFEFRARDRGKLYSNIFSYNVLIQ